MSAEDELRWYLVSTKWGEQLLAKRALESVCAEVFSPLFYEARAGAKPQPVFPCRVFVRLNPPSRYFEAKYSPGATGDLIEVPDSVVAELKLAAEERKMKRKRGAGAQRTAVSGSVRELFDPRTPSLERTVRLMRIIEERKAALLCGS